MSTADMVTYSKYVLAQAAEGQEELEFSATDKEEHTAQQKVV